MDFISPIRLPIAINEQGLNDEIKWESKKKENPCIEFESEDNDERNVELCNVLMED